MTQITVQVHHTSTLRAPTRDIVDHPFMNPWEHEPARFKLRSLISCTLPITFKRRARPYSLHDPMNNKRKDPDTMNTAVRANSNPLLAATKKPKRENKPGASNKRKLANAEEQPGGLLIVRAHSAAPAVPPPSTAPHPHPPLKKFKSSQTTQISHSQPLPSTAFAFSRQPQVPAQTQRQRYDTPDADPALDAAVRAMETEAADLRRSSRPPPTPDSSQSRAHAQAPHSSTSTSFKFTPGASKPPTKSNSNSNSIRTRRETIIDTTRPLQPEQDETPQIQRNKRLRAGAMAAIASGSGSASGAGTEAYDMAIDPATPERRGPSGATRTPGSHRRKSSVGRGKRISSAFEATGVITQPHHSVADTSFYKHIDADLPEAERMRMLLIWSSARAAAASSSSSISTTKDPPPPLPPLSQQAEQLLKAVQEDGVRRLAMRMVDLSLFGEAGSDSGSGMGTPALAPNKQNLTNRSWEGVYSGDIQSAMEEEESWKRVGYVYEEYGRRVRSEGERRRMRAGLGVGPGTDAGGDGDGSTSRHGTPTPTTPSASAKSQGKQRATLLPPPLPGTLEPREEDLPPEFQAGLRVARDVLARCGRRRGDGAAVSGSSSTSNSNSMVPSTSTRKGADPDSRVLPTSSKGYGYDIDMDIDLDQNRAAAESQAQAQAQAQAHHEADLALRARIADAEFKLDHLYVLASQARTTTDVAQRMLDARFEVLGRALDARMRVGLDGSGSGSGSGQPGVGAGVLGRYVRSEGVNRDREEADETLRLLRALARVDAARPAGGGGTSDAARRAVREVQRIGESQGQGGGGGGGAGVGMGMGIGRLTAVPPQGVGVTPRKMPGTPRRGTTPGRK